MNLIEPRFRLRIYLLTAMVLFGCGVLLSRLYEFQIDRRDFFQRQVPGPRTVSIREPGVRGAIKDRNGIELARNKRNYQVTFNLEEIQQAYRRQVEQEATHAVIDDERGIKKIKLESDIVKIVNERIIPPLYKLGLAKDYSAKELRTHFVTHGGLVPYSYRTDLDYDQFARFAEHSLELPGVSLEVQPQREYPYRALGAHILGYVQEWAKGDIPEDAARRFDHYIGDESGSTGVEKTLDDYLRGPEGRKTILKNEKGKVLGMLDYVKPGSGAEVTLTIDAGVQYLLSNVLRRAGTAAAVVMDVRTGEIIGMASVPDYNPMDFIPRISKEKFVEYETNPFAPYLDRCISAAQPGSLFKIPTAIAGGLKGVANRTYVCNGGVNFGTQRVRCWIGRPPYNSSHGALTLPKAIQQSCNPFFMQMANSVGNKGMIDSFHMLGFGHKTGIPLPKEQEGIVIGDSRWMELPGKHHSPNPIDIAFLSIGQAESMATPLQLCAMLTSVANGGQYYEPRLIKRVVAADGTVLVEDKPRLKVDLIKEGVKAEDLAMIRKGMYMAVNEKGGTASRLKLKDVIVAAKTGTAQAPGNTHNAWTLCFAPFDEPRYAVCVFVRNGTSGGKVATPLANLIISGVLARDAGKKLPLHPLEAVHGNIDPIDEIPLPEDVLASIDIADDPGETGDEAAEAGAAPIESREDRQGAKNPKPLIKSDVDEEGSVVPRARAVDE